MNNFSNILVAPLYPLTAVGVGHMSSPSPSPPPLKFRGGDFKELFITRGELRAAGICHIPNDIVTYFICQVFCITVRKYCDAPIYCDAESFFRAQKAESNLTYCR